MKEFTIRVTDQHGPLIEYLVKALPEAELVSAKPLCMRGVFTPASIANAILIVKRENLLKFKSDYAWIKLAIGQIAISPSFHSVESFRQFLIEKVDITDPVSESVISKKIPTAQGKLFEWRFTDTSDERERLRRNNLVKRFCHILMVEQR